MASVGTLSSGPSAVHLGSYIPRPMIYNQQQLTVRNMRTDCSVDSDSSGFASCSLSTCTNTSESATVHLSPTSSPDSLRTQTTQTDKSTAVGRRSSSGQKIAKFIHSLTPCRGRVARRSHSFGDLTHRLMETRFKDASSTSDKTGTLLSGSVRPTHFALSTSDLKNCGENPRRLAPSYSHQLDLSITDPTVELYEFRRLWPASFTTLVTNYLGYLTFTPDDVDRIREALVKEAKNSRPVTQMTTTHSAAFDSESIQEAVSTATRGATKRRVYTPQKSTRVFGMFMHTTFICQEYTVQMYQILLHYAINKSKLFYFSIFGLDKDLEHWYAVVNAMLNHLLEEKRFKHRFILRRPGNHSSVNELERILFPPRSRPLSVSVRNRAADQSDERIHYPAMVSEVVDILRRYDAPVVACLLARVLRRNGFGLIPTHIRGLFLQLVAGAKEHSELHQRRAIRLLFQLVPRRLLRTIIRPVFELLAFVANEPECEVDESSLAVLFSPVFFLDRTTTTPASLANPLPIRVVHMFVRFAKQEQQSRQSVARLFQVPSLFQDDCTRNLKLHMSLDNPPLSCSLKYCVTMTPSPQSQGKNSNRLPDDVEQSRIMLRSGMPKVNLTATFIAKRPRQRSPFVPNDSATPVLKSALHSRTLDFRVRRTPTQCARSQCLSVTRSPAHSSQADLDKWLS
ncbi:hypothetical protein FGIG_03185 [Fasciola gigantica]|uniref:Rho-GAP domain-containing protein n=1 Tax=Fasciola gigantica TaxID=46835 RepID=A0A504Z1Q1_FASGI|nr:hypothetical protein FGIG_03185 [Fasciola gigantica]